MGPTCWRSIFSHWRELYLFSAAPRSGKSSHVRKPRKLLAVWGSAGDASHLAEASGVRVVEAGCQRSPAQPDCMSERKLNNHNKKVLKANFRDWGMKASGTWTIHKRLLEETNRKSVENRDSQNILSLQQEQKKKSRRWTGKKESNKTSYSEPRYTEQHSWGVHVKFNVMWCQLSTWPRFTNILDKLRYSKHSGWQFWQKSQGCKCFRNSWAVLK